MKYILSALIIGFTILNAQILEVSQVFNKKLVKVQKEHIGTLKSFYGTSALNETKIYDIVTRFDGYITNLYANEQYKSIKKGKALFTIYSDEINSIQQELQIAKKFNKSLINSNIEKLKALDINSSTIKRIKSSKKTIKNISFYSPSNAIILQKNINKGSFAKKGKLLLQLASLDELWFIASVYQKDLSFIKKDMKARIYLDGIKKPIVSKVDMIYPTLDLKTKTVDVRFVLENKDLKLIPNMFGKVDIKTIEKEMLTLPKTAVLSKGDKFFVFQNLSKTEFEPIEVKAKRISSNKYEIIEGLEEGQSVINNALFLLDSDATTNGLYSSDDDDDW
ncbi:MULTISPECIES: efflux RND transporter periplasmic adaptor subunit [Arcobacteraceae]|uniref:Cation transporter n=1 Tax=Poseidonibacter parvus TaxID=1850254 RepID=A0A1P8KIM0_9BACT|nr:MULTISPECIES: efflux RND transporter periplasmic adaptor subunit [Arcobacteraceae]APW64401.1 cation transporter [Poseidonibacter parvus]